VQNHLYRATEEARTKDEPVAVTNSESRKAELPKKPESQPVTWKARAQTMRLNGFEKKGNEREMASNKSVN